MRVGKQYGSNGSGNEGFGGIRPHILTYVRRKVTKKIVSGLPFNAHWYGGLNSWFSNHNTAGTSLGTQRGTVGLPLGHKQLDRRFPPIGPVPQLRISGQAGQLLSVRYLCIMGGDLV